MIVIDSDFLLQKIILSTEFVKKKKNNHVGSTDLHNTVGINFEGDLDLRKTTRSGRNTGKLELAEVVVVLRQRTLTLEDLN